MFAGSLAPVGTFSSKLANIYLFEHEAGLESGAVNLNGKLALKLVYIGGTTRVDRLGAAVQTIDLPRGSRSRSRRRRRTNPVSGSLQRAVQKNTQRSKFQIPPVRAISKVLQSVRVFRV